MDRWFWNSRESAHCLVLGGDCLLKVLRLVHEGIFLEVEILGDLPYFLWHLMKKLVLYVLIIIAIKGKN